MTFSPSLPPAILVALAIVGAGSLIYAVFDRRTTLSRQRRLTVLGLRAIVIACLLLILANPVARREIETRSRPGSIAVLADHSASMTLGDPARLKSLAAWQLPLRRQSEAPVQFYAFDAGAKPDADTAPDQPPIQSTRLGQALLDVLESEPAELRDVVILSDGRSEDPQTLARALAACKQRGIRVSTATIGRDEPLFNLAVYQCDAPVSAVSRSAVPVAVTIHARLAPDAPEIAVPLQILDADGVAIAEQSVRLTDGRNTHLIHLPVGAESTTFTVNLPVQPDEFNANDNQYPFSIAVADSRIRVLYMEGSNHTTHTNAGRLHETQFLPQAWMAEGDVDVDLFVNDVQLEQGGKLCYVKGFDKSNEAILDHSRGFPRSRAELYAYDVIVCSDVNRTLFSDEQLQWVADLITEEGGGFCMIGGDTAFDAGGWDKTAWEKVIPVDMAAYGRGHRKGSNLPRFAEEILDHPILQFTPNREINKAILRIHPEFRGYHLIERAKPGATVLATGNNDAPLIAVQQYGRGRAMAFLSDAAGGWGDYYQNRWGPRLLSRPYHQLATAEDIDLTGDPKSLESRIGNRFYNRFWVNTIRWLAENARNRSDAPLQLSLPRTSAAPGEQIDVHARFVANPDDLPREISVSLVDSDAECHLKPTGKPGYYEGKLTIPAQLGPGECQLTSEITVDSHPIQAHALLRVNQFNREFANPNPDAAALRRIASLTDGVRLQTPQDLEAVLKGVDPGQLAAVTVTLPLWDRAWLWLLVILSLSLAWLLPKLP